MSLTEVNGVVRALLILSIVGLAFAARVDDGAAAYCMIDPRPDDSLQCGDSPIPPPPPPVEPVPQPPPPPPPPTPGPQPPPPPPAPAPTSDRDADGVPDAVDNCPSAANDQADHDGDRRGDACDSTPFTGEIAPGVFTEGSATVTAGDTTSYVVTQRCKTQRFTQRFDQFGVSWLNFIRYEGGFRVCYVPGQRIISWGSLWGDATRVLIPWDWKGNDAGYPRGVRTSIHTVEFQYRGSAAICAVGWACGPTKHPGLTIVFTDNNTMTVHAYVV
jgi:hypothetical protein